MPTYNFRYLEQVEEKLQEVGQIAEANSIHPQTIADILEAHTTLYQTSNALTDARLSARLAWRQYNALTK